MSCRARRFLTLIAAGSALALWGGWCAPGTVQAGCSGYVHVAGDEQDMLGQLHEPWRQLSRPTSDVPAPRPCDGPRCRGEKAPPAAPVAPPAVGHAEDWAVWRDAESSRESRATGVIQEPAIRFALVDPLRIDRPPRANS